MPGNIYSHYFFFPGQFFHGSPFFTRRNLRLGYTYLTGITKQTYLCGIFIFLMLVAIFHSFFQKRNSIAFMMKILRSVCVFKTVKPTGISQIFKSFLVGGS